MNRSRKAPISFNYVRGWSGGKREETTSCFDTFGQQPPPIPFGALRDPLPSGAPQGCCATKGSRAAASHIVPLWDNFRGWRGSRLTGLLRMCVFQGGHLRQVFDEIKKPPPIDEGFRSLCSSLALFHNLFANLPASRRFLG